MASKEAREAARRKARDRVREGDGFLRRAVPESRESLELSVEDLWTLPWRRVRSSNLSLVAWTPPVVPPTEPGDRGMLFARFRNGGVYAYLDCPDVAEGLVRLGEEPGGSPGGFLALRVKPYYRCQRVKATEGGAA